MRATSTRSGLGARRAAAISPSGKRGTSTSRRQRRVMARAVDRDHAPRAGVEAVEEVEAGSSPPGQQRVLRGTTAGGADDLVEQRVADDDERAAGAPERRPASGVAPRCSSGKRIALAFLNGGIPTSANAGCGPIRRPAPRCPCRGLVGQAPAAIGPTTRVATRRPRPRRAGCRAPRGHGPPGGHRPPGGRLGRVRRRARRRGRCPPRAARARAGRGTSGSGRWAARA